MPDLTTEPREMTAEECRDEFLRRIWLDVQYWDRMHREGTSTVAGSLSGLAFSLLVQLDGFAGGTPGFHVVPDPHPDDKEWDAERGKDWWPDDGDIAGELHKLFYKHKPEGWQDD